MFKGCETCEYNGWIPDDSREPWGPCDWCDDGSNYKKSHELDDIDFIENLFTDN